MQSSKLQASCSTGSTQSTLPLPRVIFLHNICLHKTKTIPATIPPNATKTPITPPLPVNSTLPPAALLLLAPELALEAALEAEEDAPEAMEDAAELADDMTEDAEEAGDVAVADAEPEVTIQ